MQEGGYVKISEEYILPSGAKVAKGEGKKGAKGFIGDLEISDANGELLFYIFKANVYDNSGDSTHTTIGEYAYTLNNNKLQLDVWVAASFFNKPTTSYPVTIDPQVSAYVGSWYYFARSSWGFTTNCMAYDYINVPQSTVTGWYNYSYYYRGSTSSGMRYVRVSYQQQWQGSGAYGCCSTNWWWQTPYYNTGTGPWGGGNMTFNVQGYNTYWCCTGCSPTSGYRNYGYYYIDYTLQPADPSAANTNINPVCNPGQTITLTASNPIGTVYWYTGGCGSNFIGTGTSINVNPNTTTTYYAMNYDNGYFSNGCASITVNVPGTPAAPSANAVSIFCGQTASLSASGNGSITWYANSNATGQLGTGASYTTPVLNATTTYYVNQTVSGCASALTPVTVTANTPSNPTANNVSINCGQTASLSASSNGGMIWYSNANGTGQLATGGNYTTPALSQTTTYYVQAGAAGCVSQITPVTVWYTNANGTGQVGTGASFTPPVLGATTTYYVASTTAIGAGNSQTFNYTGNVQTFTAPFTGNFTLELWGAQGGNDGQQGANGGYATGQISLTSGQVINVYVGGQGIGCNSASGGGWNGGGNAGNAGCSGGGGGASDIRVAGNSLNDRVIVAGGGGGGGNSILPGAGGGLVGINGSGAGGTQASGGAGSNAGSFGQGGHKSGDGGGGGGGWYGGGAAYGDDGGGGGSSYIGFWNVLHHARAYVEHHVLLASGYRGMCFPIGADNSHGIRGASTYGQQRND
ncbi:MAG: hypothetical protein EBV59_08235 [Synechococcaceae bacterium WB7_1C_051]|nr:hypothetical protein [Synechococcaceae bacterium WB7_1C_051]